MEPHFSIHGGREQNGCFAREGEVDGGKRIGGEAVGEVAQGVGGKGGDEEQFGVVGERDVPGFPRVFLVLQGNEDGVAGENLQREGGDEFGGGLGHHAMNFVPFFDQLGGEVGGLVCGNGTGDA